MYNTFPVAPLLLAILPPLNQLGEHGELEVERTLALEMEECSRDSYASDCKLKRKRWKIIIYVLRTMVHGYVCLCKGNRHLPASREGALKITEWVVVGGIVGTLPVPCTVHAEEECIHSADFASIFGKEGIFWPQRAMKGSLLAWLVGQANHIPNLLISFFFFSLLASAQDSISQKSNDP